MSNESRNWIIVVAVLLIALVMGYIMLAATLNPPIRVVVKEVQVTVSNTTSTTIVQVNAWCEYLDRWRLQTPVQAAEDWINNQEPQDEVQYAMIEFARCSEFGKETARLIWPLWRGE